MRFYTDLFPNLTTFLILLITIRPLELKSVNKSNWNSTNSNFNQKEKVLPVNLNKENATINDNILRPFKQNHSKHGKLSIDEELEVIFLRHKQRKENYLNQLQTIGNSSKNRNETIAEIKTNIPENIDGIITWKNAIDFGIESLEELIKNKEPSLYNLGLFLKQTDPAAKVASFGAPKNTKALLMSRIGYASVEASKKIAHTTPFRKFGRKLTEIFNDPLLKTLTLDNECPFRETIRCPLSSKLFRTADGTCNNLNNPWQGSAVVPMQRFLPAVYDDGIETLRKSIFGTKLPSARLISKTIHREKNRALQSVTLMFMQWGQFIDHDVTSTVKSTSFNESIPQCCDKDGQKHLHPSLLHPSCLPIDVPRNDPFLSRFHIQCMEFIRSAPSIRINCNLGWREQINQVTSYIDASTIYGSDAETSNSMRSFKNGKIFYGRPLLQTPLDPPDPPGGEICKQGAISDECLQVGDGRLSENIGLTAIHTIFVRYHNKLATALSAINRHWNDERIFQETKKIIYAAIQHITYREFLPILVGPEVMDLFELRLIKQGYYNYSEEVNPTISNAFSTAAYRFGHSLVQNSFIRYNNRHQPLFNNVSLHEEFLNFNNIWSSGSIDRLILGLVNQPIQKRDEFISDELTDHLFQFSSSFGMDLIAINIQRGRDHGIPPYTSWRQPCGLSSITDWKDLEKIMNIDTVKRLSLIYRHVDDIDLYTGGLAEKPVKGAVAGPTFACIIAQQFLLLRKGDRFWYENENVFSMAQLQQIRQISLAEIICSTMSEVETIQPFVFLSADSFRNVRQFCDNPEMGQLDLEPWTEEFLEFNDLVENFGDDLKIMRFKRDTNRTDKKLKIKLTNTTSKNIKRTTTNRPTRRTVTTQRILPKQTRITNTKYYSTTIKHSLPTKHSTTTTNNPKGQYYKIQKDHDDVTYLLGIVPEQTTKPTQQNPSIQVNINIRFPTPPNRLQPLTNYNGYQNPVVINKRPESTDDSVFVYIPQTDKVSTINNQVYQLPAGYKKPNLNGYGPKPLNTIRPYQTYVTNDLITTEKYSNIDRPIYVDHFHLGDNFATHKPVFENRPFASSNMYNNDRLYDTNPITTEINPRPIDTDSEEILNEFFDNQRSSMNTTINKENLINNKDKIDDKLDFKNDDKIHTQSSHVTSYDDKLYFYNKQFRNIPWLNKWNIRRNKKMH